MCGDCRTDAIRSIIAYHPGVCPCRNYEDGIICCVMVNISNITVMNYPNVTRNVVMEPLRSNRNVPPLLGNIIRKEFNIALYLIKRIDCSLTVSIEY